MPTQAAQVEEDQNNGYNENTFTNSIAGEQETGGRFWCVGFVS